MKRFSKISSGLLVIAFALFGCTHPPYDPSLVTLIDGENGLENFSRVGEGNWRAEDGAIVIDKGGKVASYLISKNSYSDFHLRVEFWASPDANSGIFFRNTTPPKIGAVSGYEVQIFDQNPTPNFGTGSIVRYVPIVHAPKAGGKWNTFEITAKGPYLTVVLNGERTIHTYDSLFARGPIALQYNRGTMKFRKLQIKPV